MQAVVTYATNRIDLFCREHLGGDSDETRRRFIHWNYDFFLASPTFWLPVGRRFWLTSPISDDKQLLTLGSLGRLVIPPGEYLALPRSIA